MPLSESFFLDRFARSNVAMPEARTQQHQAETNGIRSESSMHRLIHSIILLRSARTTSVMSVFVGGRLSESRQLASGFDR